MSDWLSLQKSDLLWEIISEQESISEAVNFLGKIYNFKIHPYVLWVKQESVTKEQFIQSQIPLRFAIESFSQCLAGVLAHIPHIENRATLAYNIAKSHGDNQITKGHKYNFLSYLKYLGATPEELFTSCPINLRAFTQSIQNFCLANPFYSGASLLGTLEFFFATVNSAIRNILKEKNWI